MTSSACDPSFRSPSLVPRVCSMARSVIIYVILQSVTSHPITSRPVSSGSPCMTRCLLLGTRYGYYDVSKCRTICANRHRRDVGDDADDAFVALCDNVDTDSGDVVRDKTPVVTSPMGRILEIFAAMGEPGAGAAPGVDTGPDGGADGGGWDLKFEKKTEYKQLTVPALSVNKRRWASIIGPCISAYCAGRTGAQRAACIVRMCNRKRSRYR